MILDSKCCPLVYRSSFIFISDFFFFLNLASTPSFPSYLCFLVNCPVFHCTFFKGQNSFLSYPFYLAFPLLTSSSSSSHRPSPTVSQSITHESLCVFGRMLFSATICLLLLSLSPFPVVPANATHRRSFSLLLPLKSWNPCVIECATRVVSVCWSCVCALEGVD